MENHIILLEIEAKTRRRRERGATAARTKAMGYFFFNLLYFSDLVELGGGDGVTETSVTTTGQTSPYQEREGSHSCQTV